MAKYLLDTAWMEEDFFEECLLWALGSPVPPYRLCWWLHQCLGLDFVREPESDVLMAPAAKTAPRRQGLFAEWAPAEEEEEAVAGFPVYRCMPGFRDDAVLLYANRARDKRLLPELKQVDYLLLFQNGAYWEEEMNPSLYLPRIEVVQWARPLDIASLKSRRNLIL